MEFDAMDSLERGGERLPSPVMAAQNTIDKEQCRKWNEILDKYRAAKNFTQRRIINSENWWKIRNAQEIKKETEIGKDGGFVSQSSWLHNVITNKHADAMEAYPEPNILPREEGDVAEAKMLSSIIPCILEQNGFEDTYDAVQWSKCKSGTGVYKVFWDRTILNGLGDIRVEEINLLNLYWQPGVNDIQKSRYVFQVEAQDKDLLQEQYPDIDITVADASRQETYQKDEKDDMEGKVLVVEVYYHKGSKLHYCKYVGDTVLYATENDSNPSGMTADSLPMNEAGLYDHGKYPFVFDALYPIAGSPVGYGYVDIGKNPQTRIDLMDTAITKNVMVSAIPRYLSQDAGNVDEEEFLDLSKPIIHVQGRVDEASLRQLSTPYVTGNGINMLERAVQELRETSGNTETSMGSTPSGVTAASAIAALQEASGKGSRDATRGSYRAYREIVILVIELIRQFYTLPRKFRILGQNGGNEYIAYSNAGLIGQVQTDFAGNDMGLRMPLFDVKVSAQKANVYTKISQNELSLQMYQMGFFRPDLAQQSLMCLDMMEFEGKNELIQKVAQQAQMYQIQTMLGMQMMQAQASAGGASGKLPESDNLAGRTEQEHGKVRNAREQSQNASQPNGGRVI